MIRSTLVQVGLYGFSGMLLLSTAPSLHAQDAGDPPGRVARISVIQGNVSLEPNGVETFSQAEINYPLTSGDRVYADNSSFGELQTAGLAVRLGNGADVTLSSLTDNVAQFGLAQGSIRVRTRSLASFDGQPATVEVDTPNGAILVDQPGDIRVDSYPQDDTTVVTVSSGAVDVTGQNLNQQSAPANLCGSPGQARSTRSSYNCCRPTVLTSSIRGSRAAANARTPGNTFRPT